VRRFRTLLGWLVTIAVALSLTMFVRTSVAEPFSIPSESMMPTLHKGDRVVVEKLGDEAGGTGRGDVVVFKPTGDGGRWAGDHEYLIKRVIALAGDLVETRNGVVFVNDRPVDEPYLRPGDTTDRPPIRRQRVPVGHAFVLGDNRHNSDDSRRRGPIRVDWIVGRAVAIVWPPWAVRTL
jgi:signal peptidase I